MNGLTILMAGFLLSLAKPECTCIGSAQTAKDFLKFTDIVLVGTIDTVSPVYIEIDTVIRGDTQRRTVINNKPYISLNIENYYYGENKIKLRKNKALIHTGTGFGDCGYRFIKDQRYIVWGIAYREEDTAISVHTDICFPTAKWSEGHIKALKRHKKERKIKLEED